MGEPEGRMSYRDYYGGYSRGYRRADDQIGAYSDWDRSGGGCCCGGGGYGGETSLFSDGTLFALLAGAALAFYVLYTTLTAAAATKRRITHCFNISGKSLGLVGHMEVSLTLTRLWLLTLSNFYVSVVLCKLRLWKAL